MTIENRDLTTDKVVAVVMIVREESIRAEVVMIFRAHEAEVDLEIVKIMEEGMSTHKVTTLDMILREIMTVKEGFKIDLMISRLNLNQIKVLAKSEVKLRLRN